MSLGQGCPPKRKEKKGRAQGTYASSFWNAVQPQNPSIHRQRVRIKMAYYLLVFPLLLLLCAPSPSLAQPFKAVNLGNWLVNEGWMDPSLYDGMPNNDLLVILALLYHPDSWSSTYHSGLMCELSITTSLYLSQALTSLIKTSLDVLVLERPCNFFTLFSLTTRYNCFSRIYY